MSKVKRCPKCKGVPVEYYEDAISTASWGADNNGVLIRESGYMGDGNPHGSMRAKCGECSYVWTLRNTQISDIWDA